MSDARATPPGEAVWLALHAETLAVGKRRRADEVVRVTTQTRLRDVVVDEPLVREGVVVERVPVGRYVDAVPPVRKEGDTTIMPVVEEEVVVTRRLFLREEVHLHRTRTIMRHTETISLREQVANVTRTRAEPTPDSMVPYAETDATLPTTSETIPRRSAMDEETIVAVYDTPAHADAAVADLRAANVPESAISRHHGGATAATNSTAGMPPTEPMQEKGFWSSLFGGETEHDRDASVFDRSMQSGSSVVVVRATPDHDVESVIAILERHSPIDIDERAAGYGLSTGAASTGIAGTMGTGTMGTTTRETGTMTGTPASGTIPSTAARGAPATGGVADNAGVMQLSEEQISVGKRVINRGGTRIRRYVVERPVEENVSLHSEKVTLERHPVTDGRPATDGSFRERTIEMTETAEEAVVSKTARVVEEVGLRKDVSDRVETVRDTVRKEEVEVEQVPGGGHATTSETTPPIGARPTPKV